MYQSLSKHRLFARFLSSAAVYGVSLVLTRGGWLLLLPIFWTRLTPADYGIVGIVQMTQIFLTPILGLGLYDSVQRLYHEWSPAERPRHVGALWIGSLSWAALVCLFLLAVGDALFGRILVQVPFMPYLAIATGIAFFANFMHFPLAILRTRERAVAFSLINIASFLTQATLTVSLVIVFDMGVEGYLLGFLANAVVWAVVGAALMAHEVSLRFGLRHLRQPLRYGLPMVPLAIIDGMAGLLDRFFLDKYVSLAQIGLYSLGNQFGSAFNMFNHMMKTSWLPFLYRSLAERHDTAAILSQFAVYYLTLLTVPALAIALLSKEIIALIGDERFSGVYAYVPPFVLMYYLQSIAAAMGRGMDLAKRTALWPVVAIVSLAVAVVGLALLVPRWGTMGAVTALLCSAFARMLTQVGISVYYYPRPLRLGVLARVWIVVAAAFALGYYVAWPQLWIAALGKSALIAIACVLIVRIGFGRELIGAAFQSISLMKKTERV